MIPGSGRSPEEVTATHYSILAWRIPWEPGGLHKVAKSQTWLSSLAHRHTHVSLENRYMAS